jgi:type IV pilus assembly protein PilC
LIPSPRLSSKALAELCHRLAVETEAGIDIRRTWRREADSASGRLRGHFERVRDRLARGETFASSLAGASPVFPPLFMELAHVGEETGTLGRVMQRLERHYRRHVQAQRALLAAVAWPMIELTLAVLAIGTLIWVLGFIARQRGGEPFDVLGFGLTGTRGLLIYTNFIVAITLLAAMILFAVRRGALWGRWLQRALVRLPGVGPCLEKLALARMAWALHLTLNVAMDLRRIVPLALHATENDHYIRHTDQVVASIAAGQPLAQALGRTGAFPPGFVDALAVGEESGQIVEAAARLADQYEDEAESAVRVLAMLAGVAVYVLVAALLIWLIFRLYGSYIGTINNLINDTR